MSEQPDAPARDAGGAASGGGAAPSTATGAAAAAPPVSERMQALLSRAVEDQLSEQRALASLVAEVRALIAALPGDVAAAAPVDQALRTEVAQLRAGLSAVEQRLAVLTAAAEKPADHTAVNAVGSRVDALATSLAEARVAQGSLQAKLGELSAAVAALSREQAAATQRVIAHVDDAVLALAEALVRRGRGAAAVPPSPAVSPVAAVAAAAPEDETSEFERQLVQDPPDDDSDDAARSTGEPAPMVASAVATDLDEDEDEDEDDERVVLDKADDDEADEDDEDEDEDESDDEDEDEHEDEDEDEDERDGAPEPAAAPGATSEASTWGRGLSQVAPAEPAAAPAPAGDPWVVPSPFQPGPRREAPDSGAAAALAELKEDGDDTDAEAPGERPRRRPWWRPGD